jgi:murein DD-endopeptidase MepM/ murein hydrolase activator NlpD
VLATDINSLPFETTISQKPRDKVIEYPVEGGDTLASIAKKFDVSVDTIKWANDLKTETIKPGQALKIPPVTGIVHKVEAGDSIYSIAKKYGVDAQAIVNFPFNDFADLDTFSLTVGQMLIVPNGAPPQVKPAIPYYANQLYQPPAGSLGGSGSFIWPTQGIITQYPIWYHMAFDIANNALPPVWASDAGTVVAAGWDATGYGNRIIIDHNNGYQTLYGHLSQIGVAVGQAVSRGQTIGRMGSTGRSTGPHLHFEVRQGGRQLNPAAFVHP